jgi:hypothetical protein
MARREWKVMISNQPHTILLFHRGWIFEHLRIFVDGKLETRKWYFNQDEISKYRSSKSK